MRPLLIVDAANVVGSKPDGWWRDRRGAAERLRDRLIDASARGAAGLNPPIDVIMIVEGKAKGVTSTPTVSVLDAPGSGDDEIVQVVADNANRKVLVVTADRELRRRVEELGAQTTGPRSLDP
ncbi:NTP pyrophosphohydrolase [Gordonia sp. CPCC 205333]|uniref:NTP pyrophosphohydrolase n=1 Tax=Gordonia sp. CPCC 205333 TaxID=3140790 RepID=UPI003AF3931D